MSRILGAAVFKVNDGSYETDQLLRVYMSVDRAKKVCQARDQKRKAIQEIKNKFNQEFHCSKKPEVIFSEAATFPEKPGKFKLADFKDLENFNLNRIRIYKEYNDKVEAVKRQRSIEKYESRNRFMEEIAYRVSGGKYSAQDIQDLELSSEFYWEEVEIELD